MTTTTLKRKFSRVITVAVAVVGIGRSKNKETGQLDVNCLLAVRVHNLSFEVQQNYCGMCCKIRIANCTVHTTSTCTYALVVLLLVMTVCVFIVKIRIAAVLIVGATNSLS